LPCASRKSAIWLALAVWPTVTAVSAAVPVHAELPGLAEADAVEHLERAA